MSDLDNKANTSDVLTLEEIQASTDLTNKIASASSLKNVKDLLETRVYYVGDLKTISGIKTWLIEHKPTVPWVAHAGNDGNGVSFGTAYNSYNNGYASFIYFNYFSSSLEFFTFYAGSWNK